MKYISFTNGGGVNEGRDYRICESDFETVWRELGEVIRKRFEERIAERGRLLGSVRGEEDPYYDHWINLNISHDGDWHELYCVSAKPEE